MNFIKIGNIALNPSNIAYWGFNPASLIPTSGPATPMAGSPSSGEQSKQAHLKIYFEGTVPVLDFFDNEALEGYEKLKKLIVDKPS